MYCPQHKDTKLKVCRRWKPPEGFDPKMKRYSCLDCHEYWYKAPKHAVMNWKEIVQLGLLSEPKAKQRKRT